MPAAVLVVYFVFTAHLLLMALFVAMGHAAGRQGQLQGGENWLNFCDSLS